jgi:hypothetical protein
MVTHTGIHSTGRPIGDMVQETGDGRVTLPWTDYVRLVAAQTALKRWVDAVLLCALDMEDGRMAQAEQERDSAELAAIEVAYPGGESNVS